MQTRRKTVTDDPPRRTVRARIWGAAAGQIIGQRSTAPRPRPVRVDGFISDLRLCTVAVGLVRVSLLLSAG